MPRPTSKPLLSISVAFMLTAAVSPATSADDPQAPLARHDSFGDPLPDGAVARLGTRRTGDQLPPGTKPGPSIRQIVFSPDGRRLATRGEPGDPHRPRQIHVYDAETGKPLRTLDGPARPLTGLAFAAEGAVILAATADDPDGIRLWDRDSGRLLRTIPAGRGPLAVLPGGRQVAVLAPFRTSDMVRIHDVATGNEVRRFVIPMTDRFELAPDGRTYLATSRLGDAELRIVELATANETQRLKGLTHPPTAAAFSPDARTVAAGDNPAGGDAVILVWEIASGRTVHRLAGHEGRLRALAFSPDGRWLASGGDDRTVRIWELATGREVHRFDGHAGGIASLAFSPAGDRLASGSLDRTTLVWDFTIARRSSLPSGPLGEPQLAQLWTDLADTQPAKAYYAAGLIAHLEEQVVPFLRQNVETQLVPVQRERIEQLVRELDDDDWIVRFAATEELKRLRDAALPVLQQTLRQTASAEVRQRVRRILAQADEPRFSDADVRRLLRLIQTVEPLETADAEAILQLLARDFPHAEVVDEAQQALQRRAESSSRRLIKSFNRDPKGSASSR